MEARAKSAAVFVTTAPLPGDYNASGTVEQGDLNLVLLNWYEELLHPHGEGWINDLPSGAIDQEELNTVLLNWGNTSTAAIRTASVPEPSGMIPRLLALTVALMCGVSP